MKNSRCQIPFFSIKTDFPKNYRVIFYNNLIKQFNYNKIIKHKKNSINPPKIQNYASITNSIYTTNRYPQSITNFN